MARKPAGKVPKRPAKASKAALEAKARGVQKKPALKRPAAGAKNSGGKSKPSSLQGIVNRLAKAKAIDFSKPLRKVLYVMRGPPGCGKSSVARHLLQWHLAAQGVRWQAAEGAFAPVARAFVLSTDDYFTLVDEEGGAVYDFDGSRLRELHQKNQRRCLDAMELSRTPLFIDNTNMALWEMSGYVTLADEHDYAVMIIGPEQLGEGALDLSVLQQRCAQVAGRADGKDISRETLERMIDRYEELPEQLAGLRLWPAGADELQLLKEAKPKPRPRYAGLEVQGPGLEAVWDVDPGPLFWEGNGQPGRPLRAAVAAKRSAAEPHVTVLFWGKGSTPAEVQPLLGRSFAVKVTGLVYLRGGGLLCATCEFAPEDHATLATVAGSTWRPHITLLWTDPWRPSSSNDLLAAMEARLTESEEAVATAPAEVETQLDPASQTSETQAFLEPQGAVQVLRARMGEQSVDLVVLQLARAADLGLCEFRLF